MIAADPIAAIATAAGPGGIGIVRVSGPSLARIIEGLIGRPLTARKAEHVKFRGEGKTIIDEGIALFFPGPRSYTGEDVLELQGHGGPIVLGELLKRCLRLGARAARPGEFTERAFLNGKLDLAQAESIADLINASTAQAARSALRSLQGEFSERIDVLSKAVVELRTLVEATLDFPDEEVDFLNQAGAQSRLAELRAQLEQVLKASQRGSLLRAGIQIVLAGQPNVGKSSLLNRLAGEDLAIVTEIPGTTRDLIRQSINLGGVPAHVIDTAGLRPSADPVEQAGMERAWRAIERADLVLLLVDAVKGDTEADQLILSRLPKSLPCIKVLNKIDLLGQVPGREAFKEGDTVRLSARTGAGIELLQQTILELVGWQPGSEDLYMARERHLEALEAARSHLTLASEHHGRLELFAEELRLAHEALGLITGRVTPDDLLGQIFSRFCIGK